MLSKQNNLIEDAPQKLVDELIGLYNNGQSKTVFEKSHLYQSNIQSHLWYGTFLGHLLE